MIGLETHKFRGGTGRSFERDYGGRERLTSVLEDSHEGQRQKGNCVWEPTLTPWSIRLRGVALDTPVHSDIVGYCPVAPDTTHPSSCPHLGDSVVNTT